MQSAAPAALFSFLLADSAFDNLYQAPYFFSTESQTVQDPTDVYTFFRLNSTGRFDYIPNFEGATNYTIANYSSATGYGANIALGLFKMGPNFVLGWNIRLDYHDVTPGFS